MNEAKETVGFPWLLVIQIVLAIISYLIQKSDRSTERDYLNSLHNKLTTAFPEVQSGGGWGKNEGNEF